MTKCKDLHDCKTAADFMKYAKTHGGEIQNGGRHTKIIGPNGGKVPVPTHGGDIPIGTRRSIIKMILLVGLALALIGGAIILI